MPHADQRLQAFIGRDLAEPFDDEVRGPQRPQQGPQARPRTLRKTCEPCRQAAPGDRATRPRQVAVLKIEQEVLQPFGIRWPSRTPGQRVPCSMAAPRIARYRHDAARQRHGPRLPGGQQRLGQLALEDVAPLRIVAVRRQGPRVEFEPVQPPGLPRGRHPREHARDDQPARPVQEGAEPRLVRERRLAVGIADGLPGQGFNGMSAHRAAPVRGPSMAARRPRRRCAQASRRLVASGPPPASA
ncbi:hypothetical protein D3C81_1131540 [compost metagenome]